jgi:hypothetical protein
MEMVVAHVEDLPGGHGFLLKHAVDPATETQPLRVRKLVGGDDT